MVDKDGWRLSAEPTEKLDQEGQDRLAHLKSWLAKQMRRVKLPDLLIEVDNQLGFTRNFSRLLSARSLRLRISCAVLAAVMAHGCNLGRHTMAQLTSDVTYEQPKRIGDWHLDRGGAAERPGGIGERDRGPRHLFTLGRRRDRRTATGKRFVAAPDPPADLQHPIQRLCA